MDATAVLSVASWILGEMRHSQKGSLKPDEVKSLVDGLIEKKYPLMEEVDGGKLLSTSATLAHAISRCSFVAAAPETFRRERPRGRDHPAQLHA